MYKIFINDKPFFITNSKLNIDASGNLDTSGTINTSGTITSNIINVNSKLNIVTVPSNHSCTTIKVYE